MIGRALNGDNDIFVNAASLALVEEGAEVVQHVRTRLLFYANEWFLDLNAGVPYFEEVFVRPANLGNIESLLKTVILQTDGVESLSGFAMEYAGGGSRRLTISFLAQTQYGEIKLDEVSING